MNLQVTLDSKGAAWLIRCNYLDADLVREMPARRWRGKTKDWRCPVNRGNAEKLFRYYQKGMADISQDALKRVLEFGKDRPEIEGIPAPRGLPVIREPFPHQQEALDYIYNLPTAALFCEMGLGKTKISLDYMRCHVATGGVEKVLVCCPMSVKENWAREVRFNTELEPLLHDPGDGKIFRGLWERQDFDVFIVATESLSTRGKAMDYAGKFIAKDGKTGIIVDESHMIKNPQAKRTKNITNLGQDCQRRLILTGTPIAHNPLDLFGQYYFLDPDIIGIYDWYSFRAMHAVMGGYEKKQVVGFRKIPELMEQVKPYTVIQRKQDHLELPEKTYTQRAVELTKEQKAMYKDAKERILRHDGEEKLLQNVLVELLTLQQIVSGFYAVDDKVHRIPGKCPKLEELKAIREEAQGQRVIVWCKFKEEVRMIKEAFPEALTYYGDMTPEDCDRELGEFEASENGMFVATLQKGGIGLNMAFCNLQVFYSNTFRYIDRAQAEDRCHRIGQKNPVLYIDVLARGTVDDIISRAIGDKADMAEYVLESLKTDKLGAIL